MTLIGCVNALSDDDGMSVSIDGTKVIISNSETNEILMYLELVEVMPFIKLLEQAFLTITK